MTNVTYSYFRTHLAAVWNAVERRRVPVVVQRPGHQPLALVPADELASLNEVTHLLRSPPKAARLLAAIARSTRNARLRIELERLRTELALDAER